VRTSSHIPPPSALSVSLSRSLKYGRLGAGQFLRVSPHLIKRSKTHVLSLSIGVDVILGCNGYCFITCACATPPPSNSHLTLSHSPSLPASVDLTDEQNRGVGVGGSSHAQTVERSTRETICRVHNVLTLLARHRHAIHKSSLVQVYKATLHLAPKDILRSEHAATLLGRRGGGTGAEGDAIDVDGGIDGRSDVGVDDDDDDDDTYGGLVEMRGSARPGGARHFVGE
jgi:hypothetical protein